ncbi:MAG: alpha/beta fold hydrolase [Candidatus Woesearchaeota archaeon]
MEVIKKVIQNKYKEKLVCEINKPNRKVNDSVVLILHAFTGKKENKTIHFLAKKLPEFGFETIQFDFSGHGESEGILSEANISKQLNDINSVISELGINQKNLVILGNSFSVITALGFVDKHKEIKGLILTSGRAKYLEYIDNLEQVGVKYKLFENEFIDESFIADYKKYNPINNIQRNNQPVLIIHGTNDKVVPVENAQEFYNSSKSNSKFLVLIKDADHRYSNIEFKEEVLNSCLDFLKNKINNNFLIIN